ncbi:MAG: MerR family transcriptional regulator [Janibacter sp.]
MRVGELADLAGVTARTIRYYHQAGVLPEPPRRANGYRSYSVDDLVALLRIRRLVGSGLPLSEAGSLVTESTTASTEELIDEVDRGLEARIADLVDQRRRLAQARDGGHLGQSKLAAALTFTPTDLPIATLVAHLYEDELHADHVADALLTPALRSSLEGLQERFDAIDETTSSTEQDDLADAMRTIAQELTRHLPPMPARYEQLVLGLVERNLDEPQKEFLRRLE